MALNLQVGESRGRAKLYLLYIGRSDGKAEITIKKGSTESNMPTEEQLKKVKLGSGLYTFYQEIPINDPKNLDWRRKLGGLLAKEAHRQMKQKGELPASGPFSKDEIQMEEFCLADFPENYRLWEHRRSANLENPNAPSRSDRRDAYLYGHPLGRKKRFRSPADFYYHLEWLAFDAEGDPENCRCKICSPDDVVKAGEDMRIMQVKLYGTAEEKAQLKALNPKTEQIQNMSASSTPGTTEVLYVQSQRPIQIAPQDVQRKDSSAVPSTKATPISTPIAPITPKGANPIPLVQPISSDQMLDQQMNTFIYRVGELVWFPRSNGAVGLGLVISRNLTATNTGIGRALYSIQPLSHPHAYSEPIRNQAEDHIYPWLAFSCPPFNTPVLKDSTAHYDQIRWDQLAMTRPSDAEVDASIFAAKAVDSTFTLAQMLPLPNGPTMEIGFNGLYFGGELIWVGEAVRIRGESKGRNIMVVSKIIERLHTGSKPSEVFLIGDTYELRVAPHNPARPHPPNQYLPLRMREDLKYRNENKIPRRGEEMHWKFLEGQRRLPLTQVSGRWYESRTVLPIIMGDRFQQFVQSGDISDVTNYLNPRGSSSLTEGQVGQKKPDRLQAFTRSVPPTTVLNISFDEQQSGNPVMAAAGGTVAAVQGQQLLQRNEANGGFGFVDMDQMDEGGYPGAF